jgi:hypothetical protein
MTQATDAWMAGLFISSSGAHLQISYHEGYQTTLAVRSQVKGRDQIRPRSKRYAPGATGLKTDGQDLNT